MMRGAFNISVDQSPLMALISAFGNFTLLQWPDVIEDAEIVIADEGERSTATIDAQGNLGAEEVYFPFSDAYGVEGATIQAITFAADGTMFVGTDGPDAILTVHPDRTWEPFYPGLLQPAIINFAWGSGAILYAVREAGGDQTQAILRINTQREGAR